MNYLIWGKFIQCFSHISSVIITKLPALGKLLTLTAALPFSLTQSHRIFCSLSGLCEFTFCKEKIGVQERELTQYNYKLLFGQKAELPRDHSFLQGPISTWLRKRGKMEQFFSFEPQMICTYPNTLTARTKEQGKCSWPNKETSCFLKENRNRYHFSPIVGNRSVF